MVFLGCGSLTCYFYDNFKIELWASELFFSVLWFIFRESGHSKSEWTGLVACHQSQLRSCLQWKHEPNRLPNKVPMDKLIFQLEKISKSQYLRNIYIF